jgi:proteasome assembly chaperone (PAC2) family protein
VDTEQPGFVVFLGHEPHLNEARYAEAFFDAVEALGIKRVAALGGVHAAVPYAKERDISCVYSLPEMRDELAQYAVRFSEYEGGATITTYLADKAEARGIEFFSFYAFVPAYDFSSSSIITHQVAVEEDPKAWYDILRRLNYMFNLGLDLSDLAKRAEQLITEWDARIEHLAGALEKLDVLSFMERVNAEFEERHFSPYKDLWEQELGDILEGL